jgi:hypothetical protein
MCFTPELSQDICGDAQAYRSATGAKHLAAPVIPEPSGTKNKYPKNPRF